MAVSVFNSLSNKIYKNPEFHEDFRILLSLELRSTSSQEQLSINQIRRLLETASAFSLSDNPKHQKLALKIAIFTLKQFGTTHKIIPFAVEVILTRLGDLPTIYKMLQEENEDFFSFFGESTDAFFRSIKFPEVLSKKILNQIELFSNKLSLTDFQAKIFRLLQNEKNISLSGPTSAGKSYIIHKYITYKLLNSEIFNCVYLVPTKSLIAEVQHSIMENLKENNADMSKYAIVNSAERLNSESLKHVEKRVLVLTQERLQYLLSRDKEFEFNLLVVDEAQKVKESERGVILEDVVDELIKINEMMQTVFISPYIGNPEKFWSIFDLKKDIATVIESKTPVGQNIFYVNLTKEYATVSILSEEFDREVIEIEKIPMVGNLPTAQFRIKSWLIHNLLKNSGHTLVYCNRPSECIKIANEITEDKPSENISDELREAIDFVRTHVHEQYYLANHLKSGVGYHYGRMPQFVRYVVRELFENKHINFLCCTSTLLEGVNLPAKNIVLHNPKSGMMTPMDKFSIKNLAGRAGRLGKDYYGNIYCIDIKNWETEEDPFDEELENIESSTEKTVTIDIDVLIEHLETYKIPEHGTKNVSSVATSLIMKQLRNPDWDMIESLRKKYPNVSMEKLESINSHIQNIIESISKLDKEVILRNPSIDPRLQYNLYSYLRQPNNMVLPPEPYFEEFYKNLEKIFELLQKFFFKELTGESFKFYTYVASEWILQHPYKSIIENRIRFEAKGKELSKEKINKIIDSIDDAIESYLKFEFTRGLRCYCDIIQYIQDRRGSIEEFSIKLPDYLETGAHDEKVFLLLDLGITRNNAISLSNYMTESIQTSDDVIRWIKNNTGKVKEILHPLMYKEIELILKLEK